MIVFDLKCGGGHVFEAWFGSTPAYEEQRAAGQVRCPLCDSGDVTKALMAPAIAAKGNRKPDAPTPGAIKAVMQRLASQQAEALKTSEWVGTAFAERARAMHLGEEKQAIIHGAGEHRRCQGAGRRGHPHRTPAADRRAKDAQLKGVLRRPGQAEKLVPPARFEHAAYGLGNRRSIRLSYGGIGSRNTAVAGDDQAWGDRADVKPGAR